MSSLQNNVLYYFCVCVLALGVVTLEEKPELLLHPYVTYYIQFHCTVTQWLAMLLILLHASFNYICILFMVQSVMLGILLHSNPMDHDAYMADLCTAISLHTTLMSDSVCTPLHMKLILPHL